MSGVKTGSSLWYYHDLTYVARPPPLILEWTSLKKKNYPIHLQMSKYERTMKASRCNTTGSNPSEHHSYVINQSGGPYNIFVMSLHKWLEWSATSYV